jgi:sec-independent protein translocase protein TatA
MFSPEVLIVLVVIAVLFGGSRLPHLARSLGSAKSEFEKGAQTSAAAQPAAVAVVAAPVNDAPANS